jgi:hypothetical protein
MYPYFHVAAVTPSDSVDLPTEASAFIVGVSGNVKLTDHYGDSVTIACVAGFLYPIKTKRIWQTVSGSAATGIVALW